MPWCPLRRYACNVKPGKSNAGGNVNPHPGTRWGLVGKRRGFDRNRIPEGVGHWEIFVFKPSLGYGDWVGICCEPAVAKSAVVHLKDQLVCFGSLRGECFCYLNLVICNWNLSHLLSKSGAIHKMNTHLQFQTYTFSFRLRLLFIFCPFSRAGRNEF